VRSVTRPEHWQVFEAYALEGCLAAEVARRFGITKIGVRVIQHRIVQRLKAQWNTLLVQELSDPFP
jgi:DNA-directed RNA polymerase specialized sigma24 family protein